MTWICSNIKEHIFNESTEDQFCPKCPPYSGVLIDTESVEENTQKRYIALQILLVDCSSSVFEDVFPNSPLKRAKLVSGLVSNAIFEMEYSGKKEDVYFSVFLFTNQIKPFINLLNIKEVFERFEDIKTLEAALYKEMESMNGTSDINLALQVAFESSLMFLECYDNVLGTPMFYPLLDPRTGYDYALPNCRSIIITGDSKVTIPVNERMKSLSSIIKEKYNSNLLSIIYLGDNKSEYYQHLKKFSDDCLIHNEKKILHFSEPSEAIQMRQFLRLHLNSPSNSCYRCLDRFMLDK